MKMDYLNAAIAGDEEAWRKLYAEWSRYVKKTCLFVLKNPDLAEDATQEVFLGLIRTLRQYNGQASFGTWLYRITVNRCYQLVRKKKLTQVEFPKNLPDHAKGALRRLLEVESIEKLSQALLKTRYIDRRILSGTCKGELMKELGLSAAAAHFAKYRARLRLKGLLK